MAKKDRHVVPETLGSFNLAPPTIPNMTVEERKAFMGGEGKSDDNELAQVINVTMTTNQVDIPQGMGISPYKIGPFDISPPVAIEWAESILRHSTNRVTARGPDRRLGETGKPTLMIVQPAQPTNFKMKEWKDPNTNRIYTINTYRPKFGTLRPDGRPMYHSEEQAFFVISKMLTVEAIQRYVQDFDNRPNVVNFAHTVINYRQEQQLARVGVTSRVSRAVN